MENNDQRIVPRKLGRIIFFSRWLQAPLYLGLIVAQAVYVYRFFAELLHLLMEARSMDEKEIMMIVLGLIDVVMIANLLIMVVIGGYETFVSRLQLRGHPDEPEWLSHVNAGVLKVKLATALIGISSVNLLQTFIGLSTKKPVIPDDLLPSQMVPPQTAAFWQVVVHLTFVLSALLLAVTDRISTETALAARKH